jgi:hypothetical protein
MGPVAVLCSMLGDRPAALAASRVEIGFVADDSP